jgi:hypothetical protein
MFPSGRWQGYYEYNNGTREYMEGLVFRFADGQIEGEGWDPVGEFTFRGRYDERGSVTMVKQYLGQHQVLYRGTYDGEGTIFGRWSIGPHWTGPFAFRPERAAPAAEAAITSLNRAPGSVAPER